MKWKIPCSRKIIARWIRVGHSYHIIWWNRKKKKRKNNKFLDSECYFIIENDFAHGPAAAVKTFKKSHPHLSFGESTVRSLRAKQQDLSKEENDRAFIKYSITKTWKIFDVWWPERTIKKFPDCIEEKKGCFQYSRRSCQGKGFHRKKPGRTFKEYWFRIFILSKESLQTDRICIPYMHHLKAANSRITKEEGQFIIPSSDCWSCWTFFHSTFFNNKHQPNAFQICTRSQPNVIAQGIKYVAIKGLSFTSQ